MGQANYGAAKAGITALTLSAARGLEPLRRARQRDRAPGPDGDDRRRVRRRPELADGQVDALSPEHVVTLVRYLSSPASEGVNGQLFIVYGPTVTLVAAPTAEKRFTAESDAWDPADLGATLQEYFADRDPELGFLGDCPDGVARLTVSVVNAGRATRTRYRMTCVTLL